MLIVVMKIEIPEAKDKKTQMVHNFSETIQCSNWIITKNCPPTHTHTHTNIHTRVGKTNEMFKPVQNYVRGMNKSGIWLRAERI